MRNEGLKSASVKIYFLPLVHCYQLISEPLEVLVLLVLLYNSFFPIHLNHSFYGDQGSLAKYDPFQHQHEILQDEPNRKTTRINKH